jgi:hypothetical protein
MNSPLGNRRNGYENPREVPLDDMFDDETLQQCYHLMALQTGPEMEHRIALEVSNRVQKVFLSHKQELEALQVELSSEKDKNELLTRSLTSSRDDLRHLLAQFEQIKDEMMGAKKNTCSII